MLSGWVFVCIPKWNDNDLVSHFFRPFGGKKHHQPDQENYRLPPVLEENARSLWRNLGLSVGVLKCWEPTSSGRSVAQRFKLNLKPPLSFVVANGNKPRTLGLTGISKGEDLEKRLRPALALEIVPWSWCSLVKLSACFFPLLYVYIYVHERVYCMVFYFGKPIGVDVSNCFYRSSSYLNVFSRSHQLSGYLQSHPRSALTR